jgi:uncharacterized protein (TIGR00725 family)
MNKTITVFGSAKPLPGEKEYITAYKLGRILGEIECTVCTGGYQGIMDAVSKGAKDMGAKVVGIILEKYFSKPSEHLSETVVCKTLLERVDTLINRGDGFIVLEGGTGTMLELAAVWEYMNKALCDKKPVACIGDIWRRIVAEIDIRLEKEERESGLIKCFDTIEECAEYVCSQLE